jgi:transcriptional regulator with XRE-family HTH domain
MSNANARLNLAQNVKFLRHLLGWSQEDLASRMSVSVPTISGLERGVRNANLDTIIGLADALGVRVENLFEQPSSARSIELARGLVAEHLDQFEKSKLDSGSS